MDKINVKLEELETLGFNSVIIGSGAAGLNCALHLKMEGIPPEQIAIITDNLGGGTSFNTGSDKQTYYKLSIIGDQLDSPYNMAKDLFKGGAMHGDTALIEATNSIREFFHLIQLGVRFPHDEFGGYVGYKTDNDPKQRATSVGPLTSQEMGRCLLKAVNDFNIKIFDANYALCLITSVSGDERECIGVICLQINNAKNWENSQDIFNSIKILKAQNVIIATGGPANLYAQSVYPRSQNGSSLIAIKAGCQFQNLTESQFGLGSVGFRWNLSGSYQQVVPRYVSIDNDGKEQEFLNDLFPNFTELSRAVFLKGYQWPFSSERIEKWGSSLVDLAVYHESVTLGKKIYLDFMRNPQGYENSRLDELPKEYLTNSNALGNNPFDRLKKLNEQAIHIYFNHGIDLSKDMLEIALCNQHLNGGISTDTWWESTSVKHLFAIGEINGGHGVHRPGGSALNAGQVGGLRAAQKIAHGYKNNRVIDANTFNKQVELILMELNQEIEVLLKQGKTKEKERLSPDEFLNEIQLRMSRFGGINRSEADLGKELEIMERQVLSLPQLIKIEKEGEFLNYLRVKDALWMSYFILNAIKNYHDMHGSSRGAFILSRDNLNTDIQEEWIVPPGNLDRFKFIKSDNDYHNKIQCIGLKNEKLIINWVNVRDVPSAFGWFETTWKKFKEFEFFKG